MLTYAFTTRNVHASMAVNYTLNGQSYSNQTSVTFNPNVDTLQIELHGRPHQGHAHMEFQRQFHQYVPELRDAGHRVHDRRHQRRS